MKALAGACGARLRRRQAMMSPAVTRATSSWTLPVSLRHLPGCRKRAAQASGHIIRRGEGTSRSDSSHLTSEGLMARDCPGDGELARWLAGALPADQAGLLEGHLEACVDCQAS